MKIEGPKAYQLGDVLLYPGHYPELYLVIKVFGQYSFLDLETNEVVGSGGTLEDLYKWGHSDELKVDAHVEMN